MLNQNLFLLGIPRIPRFELDGLKSMLCISHRFTLGITPGEIEELSPESGLLEMSVERERAYSVGSGATR